MMRMNMSQINGLVVIMIVDDGSIIGVQVINECQLYKGKGSCEIHGPTVNTV